MGVWQSCSIHFQKSLYNVLRVCSILCWLNVNWCQWLRPPGGLLAFQGDSAVGALSHVCKVEIIHHHTLLTIHVMWGWGCLDLSSKQTKCEWCFCAGLRKCGVFCYLFSTFFLLLAWRGAQSILMHSDFVGRFAVVSVPFDKSPCIMRSNTQ